MLCKNFGPSNLFQCLNFLGECPLNVYFSCHYQVIPKVPYQFQVVAREDKGPVLGVDYTKSQMIEFKTSSLNHESDYVPPKDSEVVVTPAPQPEGPTTASPLEERGQQGVVFNGSLTIELLAVIVVGNFIGLIIIVGIVYRCICGFKVCVH